MIFKFIGFWLSGEHKVSQFISVHKPAHITRRQDLVGPFGFTFYTAEMMLVWLMSTDITYDQIDIHHPMTGWLVYLPLWKIWVRQLGWWNSQYDGKVIKFHGSKSPTRWILLKSFLSWWYGSVSKPCTPSVHIKIAGKWMFIPLKMVLIGIDPYPYGEIPWFFHWTLRGTKSQGMTSKAGYHFTLVMTLGFTPK